jgi:hypothetical protein
MGIYVVREDILKVTDFGERTDFELGVEGKRTQIHESRIE